MGFFAELRQRKVFRVAAAYLVAAWLAVQVASIALPAFEAPAWTMRVTILLFALGFPIALLMAWALELTPDGLKLDMTQHGSKRMLGTAAVFALLALGWYARDAFTARAPAQTTTASAPTTATATTTADDDGYSIAVLPFTDMSAERDQDYLSDGLAEEVLNKLAQIEGLDVRARTSSFAFKGRNEDVRVIGRKLDADYLLEGSVRKSGDRLRITAQLIRASNGSHLWSKAYNAAMQDIFAVQEQVAGDVATALSVKLDVGDLSRDTGGTTHVEAYEKFLQAQAAMARIDSSGAEQALVLLREAVELDPDFGAAWVSLVQTLYDLPGPLHQRPDAARKELADILAFNLKVAPDAPWTQHLLAYDHLAHHRWTEAEAAIAKVTATPYGTRRLVDPWSNPPIYLKWAQLFGTGRVADAFKLTDAWVRTDPLSLYATTVKIMFLPYLGRAHEQAGEVERGRTMEGDRFLMERTLLLRMLGSTDANPVDVRAQFARVVQGRGPQSLDRRLFDAVNRPDAARKLLRSAFDDPAYARSLRTIAEYADGFGDKELALAALRKAVLNPVWRTPYEHGYMLWYPYKTGLRSDPRYKDLLREIGLVDYWRKSGNWGDICAPVGTDDFECR